MGVITVAIEDRKICAALEAEAQREGKSVEIVVLEALEEWLKTLAEEEEDIADSEATLKEYYQAGGVDAFEYFSKRERAGDLSS